jgi:hypothetical protein
MFVVGYAWILCVPLAGLSRSTWIDENALQPSQVDIRTNFPHIPSYESSGRLTGYDVLGLEGCSCCGRVSG